MTDTTDLKARLRATRDSGQRTIGGGQISANGKGETWGCEPIMVLANPDGPEAADALDAKDRTIAGLEAEVERLSDILDTERYRVAIGVQAIRKAVDGRRWLSEGGRGFYTYDDERYQQEFGAALDEIAAALEPLRKIAGDWSDCPTDPLRVAANRNAALKGQTQ